MVNRYELLIFVDFKHTFCNALNTQLLVANEARLKMITLDSMNYCYKFVMEMKTNECISSNSKMITVFVSAMKVAAAAAIVDDDNNNNNNIRLQSNAQHNHIESHFKEQNFTKLNA